MALMRLGSACMILVTAAVEPVKSTFKSLALIPITVIMQLAKALATVSVGEKASPFPLLSKGASEMISLPDWMCMDDVL